MNPEELLLRDIHLPDPVSWWPPAIGWWLLAGAILLFIGAIIMWRRRREAQRNAPTAIAGLELARLRVGWVEHGDAQRFVNELSTWLRRAGMSISSRQQAASLTGADWSAFLDDIAGEPVFGTASAHLIAEAPYRRLASPDGEKMLALCERWLAATAHAQQSQRS
jgi:hypothetical protein